MQTRDEDLVDRVVSAARGVEERYAPDGDRPLGSYLGALGVYGASVGLLPVGCGTGGWRCRSGCRRPIWP